MCVKTDSCFIDGAQFGGLVDRSACRIMPWSFITDYFDKKEGAYLNPEDLRERHNRTFPDQSQGRYQPAQSKPLLDVADKRYYKLHNGDILDMENETIINRQALNTLLDD